MVEMVEKYKFLQLDPRSKEQPVIDMGVEVTISGVSITSGINLDHHGKEATAKTPSACEQAVIHNPPDGFIIGTVRTDADSVTAMAVIANKGVGRKINLGLVSAVGLMDRHGPKVEEQMHHDLVVAIARRAADFKVPLDQRVAFVQSCLDGTYNPDEIASLVEARNREYEEARKASKVETVAGGRIAVVVSTHRFATNIGYEMAQVVVATNPAMPVIGEGGKPTGETYLKHTVCRWDSNVPLDIEGALQELQQIEPKWGGQENIKGSTQNISSVLTTEQVVSVVEKYLRSEPGDRLCNCGIARVMESHERTPFCG